MIDEALQEDATQYVLGQMSEADAIAFRTRLDIDEELRHFVRDLEPAVAGLVFSVSSIAPPPELLGRILREVRPTPVLVQSHRKHSWVPWALAAGLAVACGLLGWNEVRIKQQAAVAQHNILSQVKIAPLTAQVESYAKVSAVVVWNAEEQRGMLELSHLPALDAEHDYQLWVIDPAQAGPVSAGLIRVAAEASVKVPFQPVVAVKAAQFALSIEAKGGGTSPQGQIVLAGG